MNCISVVKQLTEALSKFKRGSSMEEGLLIYPNIDHQGNASFVITKMVKHAPQSGRNAVQQPPYAQSTIYLDIEDLSELREWINSLEL